MDNQQKPNHIFVVPSNVVMQDFNLEGKMQYIDGSFNPKSPEEQQVISCSIAMLMRKYGLFKLDVELYRKWYKHEK